MRRRQRRALGGTACVGEKGPPKRALKFLSPKDSSLDFRPLRLLQGGLEQPRRLGAQHGGTARRRGSLADATGNATAARGGEKGLWNSYPLKL
jgi:hypothetical protein